MSRRPNTHDLIDLLKELEAARVMANKQKDEKARKAAERARRKLVETLGRAVLTSSSSA
jgi:hypothetical protein